MSAAKRRQALENKRTELEALLPKEVTPWNPSRRAVARVTDPLPAPTLCHYCGSGVELVNNSAIYGTEYGGWPWAFLCVNKACRAYVGLHPFTGIPLGTLADAETRRARHLCKAVFNPMWQSGRVTRRQAYEWLAAALGLSVAECHIGWFDAAQCRRAIEAINSTID